MRNPNDFNESEDQYKSSTEEELVAANDVISHFYAPIVS